MGLTLRVKIDPALNLAMLIVMLATGLMGPRTKGLELEKISH
jgi:hypothetical protein